eukprot:g11809.t1
MRGLRMQKELPSDMVWKGLASSAEELEEALQQVLANEAEKQASIDLAAAQSELLELHAELLMAEAGGFVWENEGPVVSTTERL